MTIKICGLLTPGDATAALDAGATMLSLILVPGRRRSRTVEQARAIVGAARRVAPDVPVVGVCIGDEQPVAEINRLADETAIDLVQLAGNESPEFVAAVDLPVLKVLRVSPGDDPAAVIAHARDYLQAAPRTTFNLESAASEGGTGTVADWATAAAVVACGCEHGIRFMLGGGLTPDNVGEAIRTVRPAAVDVSTGVETAGVKDPSLLRSFVDAANAAFSELD
jgi:phosphoribosylanthranilate isomerase